MNAMVALLEESRRTLHESREAMGRALVAVAELVGEMQVWSHASGAEHSAEALGLAEDALGTLTRTHRAHRTQTIQTAETLSIVRGLLKCSWKWS